MPRLLLFIALLAVAIYAIPKLVSAARKLDAGRRRRLGHGLLALGGVALFVLVLARFGLQWLGVVGAALWAIVRTLAPWALRLLPFSQRFRERWGGAQAPPRDAGAREGARRAGGMSRAEALEVLGLEEGASKAEILAAYRSLMRKVHPDAPGGSTYLATKLNQAKDILLA